MKIDPLSPTGFLPLHHKQISYQCKPITSASLTGNVAAQCALVLMDGLTAYMAIDLLAAMRRLLICLLFSAGKTSD